MSPYRGERDVLGGVPGVDADEAHLLATEMVEYLWRLGLEQTDG